MFSLLLIIAFVTGVMAVKLEKFWCWGICFLSIAAAIWGGMDKWLAHDFEAADASELGSSHGDSCGGGD